MSDSHPELESLVSQEILDSTKSLEKVAIRGHACMKIQEWDLAIRDFDLLVKARKDDVHATFCRGMAYFQKGEVHAALKDLSRVLQLNLDHVMARYARAGCYNIIGKLDRAIEDYTIALQYDSNNSCHNAYKKLKIHEDAEKIVYENMRRKVEKSKSTGDIGRRSDKPKVVVVDLRRPVKKVKKVTIRL